MKNPSLIVIAFLLLSLPLRADRLDDQIRLLLPDETASGITTERQYLRQSLEGLIVDLENAKLGRKSVKKQIAGIRQQVNARYLKRFKQEASLMDFFRNGEYNDLSLALVYAILLEHFEINYAGLVNHWETEVIADPNGQKVRLTMPKARTGSAQKTRAFRYDYVELINLTILPAQRPKSANGVDSLFQLNHYAPREALDFSQMAAYAHYRQALQFYRTGEFLEVIRFLNVASLIDDRPAFDALEQATYLQLAELDGEDGQQALFYFFELWNKKPENKYLPAALLTHFIHATDQLLLSGNNDFGTAEQLYTFLESRGNKHPHWQKQLKELYYLQKSRFWAAQGRYDKVRSIVDSLYRMQPNNPVFKDVAGNLTLRALRASGTTGEELREKISEAIHRYPFLLNNPATNDLLLQDQARNIRRLYDADQGYRGDNQLAIFRTQVSQLPSGPRRSLWVLDAYVAASNYYFRLGNYQQALHLVTEALRFAPEDDYLLHRQEVLQRY